MTDLAESLKEATRVYGLSPSDGVAVGVVKDGEPIARYCGGLANRVLERPFAPTSGFRICSITKHFVCLVLLMAENEGLLTLGQSPSGFFEGQIDFDAKLTLHDLCTNRSGLLDYWCAAMLFGAGAESTFTRENADAILPLCADGGAPSQEFSYCNTNFMVLGRIIEKVYGSPLSDILTEKIFDPAGMRSTYLGANTAHPLPGWTIGYETDGNDRKITAETNIIWEGDAGIVSNLEDMLAWEKQFHDEGAPLFPLTNKLTAGDPETGYKLGMRVAKRSGRTEHLHTGGLRGWRSARLFLADERLSVVVLMNHMREPASLARLVADNMLNENSVPNKTKTGHLSSTNAKPETKKYISRTAGIVASIQWSDDEVIIQTGGRSFRAFKSANDHYERVDDNGDRTTIFRTTIKSTEKTLDSWRLELPDEGGVYVFEAIDDDHNRLSAHQFEGAYHHPSGLGVATIKVNAGGLMIEFDGFLGRSRAIPLYLTANDVATFTCSRALDHPAPGEFTCTLKEDQGRKSLTVSCWHARGVRFESQSPR
ncbi:MAG: serine hydrolase [Pseudomonadota bacterium]